MLFFSFACLGPLKMLESGFTCAVQVEEAVHGAWADLLAAKLKRNKLHNLRGIPTDLLAVLVYFSLTYWQPWDVADLLAVIFQIQFVTFSNSNTH